MTWRSAINSGPLEDEEGYWEWVEQIIEEPWFLALEDLVKWTEIWVGTEAQLIEELRVRVGKEVSASPDFPSTLEQLEEYKAIAADGFCWKDVGFLDFRGLTEEDLADFDVSGWGPETPVLVVQGDAAYRPDFWEAQFKLLKYWHPLPVGILMFTDSKKFPTERTWHGTTRELSEKLLRHFPTHRNIPWLPLDRARPEGIEDIAPWPGLATREERDAMVSPVGREGYLTFSKMMKKWAPILKVEARIKISWEKRTIAPGMLVKIEHSPKIYWTIEAPRWYKPDLSHAWGSRPDRKST
jgi:hypothetical protein